VRSVYLEDVRLLREHLTQSVHEVGVSEALRESVKNSGLEERYPGEIYRQKMEQIWRRMEADEYRSGEDLLADLRLVQSSLLENRGERIARGDVGRLMEKVRLFGLHLAPLEVREDARRTAAAIAEIFRAYGIADDYLALPEEEKQALLTREILSPRPLLPAEPRFSGDTNDVIATWRAVAEAHRRYGPAALDSAIASMSRHASDVLAMLLFASEVGVERDVDLGLREGARRARQPPAGDDRLLGQREGRRLPDVQVGAVQGAAGAGGRLRAARRAAGAVPRAGR
jgi:phosphoenolpyruvate carboxylase